MLLAVGAHQPPLRPLVRPLEACNQFDEALIMHQAIEQFYSPSTCYGKAPYACMHVMPAAAAHLRPLANRLLRPLLLLIVAAGVVA